MKNNKESVNPDCLLENCSKISHKHLNLATYSGNLNQNMKFQHNFCCCLWTRVQTACKQGTIQNTWKVQLSLVEQPPSSLMTNPCNTHTPTKASAAKLYPRHGYPPKKSACNFGSRLSQNVTYWPAPQTCSWYILRKHHASRELYQTRGK